MEFIAVIKKHKQLLKANVNCMSGWNCIQKTSGSPLNTEIIKRTHKIMMEHWDGKDILAGEYRRLSVFAGYDIFAPAGNIERHMEGAIFRFHETKKDDPIMAATNLFGSIIHLKMETEEFIA